MTMSIHANANNETYDLGTATWCYFAELCSELAPDVFAKCRHWYTNDGDGLAGDDSIRLADILQKGISDGSVDAIITERTRLARSLPDEVCRFCGGTGVRTDTVGVKF